MSALAIAMRNSDIVMVTYLLRECKLDKESTNVVSDNISTICILLTL